MDSDLSHLKSHQTALAGNVNHQQFIPMLPSTLWDASRQPITIHDTNMPEALMSFQRKDAIYAGGGKG